MRLTGGEIIAEYLIKEKVPYIIGIPGHGSLGLVDAFISRRDKIRMIGCKQEMSAVHMADGYYRTTGKPLAVYTSIGPGAINTAIGVATAYVDSTAVLVITGDAHVHMRGKGLLQEIERSHDSNFARIFDPITKRYWVPTMPGQLPSIMHRAFNQMLTGRRGPVLISMPMDVQSSAADVEIPDPDKYRTDALSMPDPKMIEKAADLLYNSERPVILAGGGVLSARAASELRAVAEFTGAAVLTTMQSKSVFPDDHPLYAIVTGSKGTSCGVKVATTADTMLAVGCRFADETAGSYNPGKCLSIPPTKLIHMDIDENEIGKNYPVEVGIISDAKSGLASLLDALQSKYKPKDFMNLPYTKEVQALRKDWEDSLEKWRNYDSDPMMISCMLKEIRSALSRDAIVSHSSGNTQAQIMQEFPFYEPYTNLTSGGFSTMGMALPAALGAKLAHPDTQVVAIMGDGDFMMTMQEMATAAELGLNIVVVLANNSSWIAIKDLQMDAYGKDRTINVDFTNNAGSSYSPDFTAVAKAFDWHAQKITKAQDIQSAMSKAFDSGKPALIECIVSREFPYTGSPTVGWWDVPVPEYLKDRFDKYVSEKQKERL